MLDLNCDAQDLCLLHIYFFNLFPFTSFQAEWYSTVRIYTMIYLTPSLLLVRNLAVSNNVVMSSFVNTFFLCM